MVNDDVQCVALKGGSEEGRDNIAQSTLQALNGPNTEPTSPAVCKAACFIPTVCQETETQIRLNSMYRIQGHSFFCLPYLCRLDWLLILLKWAV